MRILHTSDWHLGQHFIGKTRQAEHQAFIGWLIQQVELHRVDAVLIAGDVFDTGAPPSYARELYHDLVVALRDSGATLLVLGGNHDSVATLGESRALLARLNARVIPGVAPELAEQLLLLPQRDGQPGAIVCAIPFIRPRDVLYSQAGETAQDKQQSLQQAIQQHYHALFALAEARRNELGLALPIIATGHLATVGASASESVREIYVGSLEAFPSNAFPAADYIALGHIHRPQKVGGLEHIRYCGSPIPLSFDEARQQKEVLLVEFSGAALHSVTPLPVPRFQWLQSLRGSLDELARQIAESASQLGSQQTLWLELLVSGDGYLNDLQARVASMIDGLPVEVLRIRRDRSAGPASLQGAMQATLAELSPTDVFEQLLDGKADAGQIDAPLKLQLRELYRQVLVQVAEEQA